MIHSRPVVKILQLLILVGVWTIQNGPILLCQARLMPAGAGYVGAGYDLLQGNLDGASFTNGGLDPGLRLTRVVLQKNIDVEDRYCPKEALCVELEQTMDEQVAVIADTVQYRSLYSSGWKFESDEDSGVDEVTAGSANSALLEARLLLENSSSIVIDRRQLSILSEVRYNYAENKLLTNEFYTNLCDLPTDLDEAVYRKFIANWGTHVIVGVQLGIIKIHRLEVPVTVLNEHLIRNPKFTKIIKVDARHSIASYVSTDIQSRELIEELAQLLEKENAFKNWKFSSGSTSNPSPVKLTLKPITDFIREDFLASTDHVCSLVSVEKIRQNFEEVLWKYRIESSINVFQPITRTFGIEWPKSSYALIKTLSCPENNGNKVWSSSGEVELLDRLTNFIDRLPDTEFSVQLDRWRKNTETLSMEFCIKLSDSKHGIYSWPMGSYCIFKKNECPVGFKVGSMVIPAIRATVTNNALPDGSYAVHSATFQFCCRNDQPVDRAIILPTSSPFALLPVGDHCQKVKGMESGLRSQSFKEGTVGGEHPYVTISKSTKTMRLHFCYYKRRTENDED